MLGDASRVEVFAEEPLQVMPAWNLPALAALFVKAKAPLIAEVVKTPHFQLGDGPDGGLFALRLNGDGSLDTSFNATGVRVIDLGPADGLAIQPSGQIVISGTGADGYLIRLNASDGSTDTSFGTDGVVTLAGTVFKITTISPTNGRLIVMGQSSGNQTVSRFSVDGVLDAMAKATRRTHG